MFRYIKILIAAVIAVLTFSCSDEFDLNSLEKGEIYDGIPVEFFIEAPDEDLSTRGVDNSKTRFLPGEKVHINALFYDEAGILVETAYMVYELNTAGTWKYTGNTPIYWPPKSRSGKFKAYYISRYQDMMEKDDIWRSINLSDIDDQTDPLYAEAKYEWGHKVALKFRHILTHLTFTNLDPDISDYFWLVNKNDGVVMNNIFKIRRNAQNEIETIFESEGDATYNGLVYIQHRSKNLYDNNIKVGSEVSFFLQPGNYSNVDLRTINNYSFLNYKSDATSDLQPNVPYVIDIKVNKGITYVEDEEKWDDDDNVYEIVDPEAFLQSVVDGTDYTIREGDTDVTILQSTVTGTLLCKNVSFNKKPFEDKFEVPSGRCFDGGNHFISDLVSNLFTTNSGTIQHLGLKNIKCEEIELWNRGSTDERSRWGALCEINAGIIKNIKIEDSELTFKIGDGKEHPGYVFNAGSLVGSNTGTISGIKYSGSLRLSTSIQNDVNSTLYLGGIVGQALGNISDIGPSGGGTLIEIVTHLKGDQSTLYVGGAIGQSAGNISDISLPNVIIDSSDSFGNVGAAGGLVGRLFANVGSPGELSSCTVSGVVKGCEVKNYNQLSGYSYTGGLAGYVNLYAVKDCRSLCSVEVNGTNSATNIIYATGGGMGRIVSENEISGNYIYPAALSGPQDYTGNFTGLAPYGVTWENYYKKAGNEARDFLSGKFVGGSIQDASDN